MVSAARTHPSRGLWLRWSWRDLRAHWVAVIVVALVMSIGIGVYAGLGSTAEWRRTSNDESFAALHMHDLRIALSPGTFVDEGSLVDAVGELATADDIGSIAERLVVDSQLDVQLDDESVLVQARLVGTDLADDAGVDGVWVRDGTRPGPADDAGVLEAKFADHWGLPTEGQLILAGNRAAEYTGLGMIPEDFFYEGPEGSILSLGELAPLYLPLAEAQDVVDRPGQINDLVLTVAGADVDAMRVDLEELVSDLGLSATVSTFDDAEAVRLLYDDIENDQRVWNAVAALILFAAGLAAFNLVTRIVEAQRREIGIGMALGVDRRHLAIRPLLVGAQVAVAGTIAGLGVGALVARAMQSLLQSFLPLPVYRTDFQADVFGRAALLGILIPVVAAALPVWRAVRVQPIEAIRTGHLAARSSRSTDWTARLRLPGSSVTKMPIRNVLRTPRRTLLTAIGVGAAITALVGVLGMLDSFSHTIDQVDEELARGGEDRTLLQLDTFYPTDSAAVAEVRAAESIGAVDTAIRLPIGVASDGATEHLDLLLEIIDLDEGLWSPSLPEPGADPTAGVLLARKAAEDLGLDVGDVVTIRHPVIDDRGAFALAESEMTVAGIHGNPLRTFAYMDQSNARDLGFAGLTNFLHAYPADGFDVSDLKRDVFGMSAVTSSQSVGGISEGFDEALEQFVGFLGLAGGAVLLLAILIAFNSTRITVDERRREHATMSAFGLPTRSIMGVVVKESVIIGVLATIFGIVAGLGFLGWMLNSLTSTTLPDLGLTVYLSPTTLLIAAGVGIVAVAVAPLFLTRRISRMDIPDTLRVME